VNANRVALVFAALIGGWHALWAFLVLLGWAQLILDFIFWAHMIKPIYIAQPFDPTAAAMLIIVTAAIGYAFGFAGALIWNRFRRG
jgi:hypothetical protein